MLSEHFDFYLRLAAVAQSRRDLDAAQRYSRKALEKNPLLVRAYGRLATIEATRRNADGIQHAIAAGLREMPRRKSQLRQMEGRAYQRMGELERALAAYRQAIPRGPFSYPTRMRALVDRLEKRVQAGAGS